MRSDSARGSSRAQGNLDPAPAGPSFVFCLPRQLPVCRVIDCPGLLQHAHDELVCGSEGPPVVLYRGPLGGRGTASVLVVLREEVQFLQRGNRF